MARAFLVYSYDNVLFGGSEGNLYIGILMKDKTNLCTEKNNKYL